MSCKSWNGCAPNSFTYIGKQALAFLEEFHSSLKTDLPAARAKQRIESKRLSFLDRVAGALMSPPMYRVNISYEAGRVDINTFPDAGSKRFVILMMAISLTVAAALIIADGFERTLSIYSFALPGLIVLTWAGFLFALGSLGALKHYRFKKIVEAALSEV